MIRLIPLALVFLLILSQPAHADPISAFLATLGKAFAAKLTVKAIATAALKTLIKTGISVLLAKASQKDQREPGLVTTHTTSGGTDPQATVVGKYASGGHVVYQNAFGDNNMYNVFVIEFGDLPGATLSRVIIDGEYSDIGTVFESNVGYRILSKEKGGWGHAWLRFYDGTQTEADQHLVTLFGNDPERPWTDDHILTGVCYGVFTFYRKGEMFPNGRPDYKLELNGPGFYDLRQDSTAGGDGAQRFDDPTTWPQTNNLMIVAYNILRGIRLPCGRIYGGDFDAEDLPVAEWTAAFDACDLGIGDDNRPQFRGGYEIKFEEAPADILKEILAACNAQIVEVGGYWYPLVGDSGAAVAEIDVEQDLIVSEGWKHEPFPGVESTFNAISTTHPSPPALWGATSLETITKEDWVEEDGGTKLFDLSLPMVWDSSQARQIADALLLENRHFRTHQWPMLPEHFHLRPLKTINATSSKYGYQSKSFRITEVAYDLLTLTSVVSLRECDPADYDPDLNLERPEPTRPTSPIVTTDAGVPGLTVNQAVLNDAAGTERAPAIRITWAPSLADSTEALSFQAKVDGREELITASTADVVSGQFVLEPVIAATDYRVRAKPIAKNRATDWSVWLPITTPNVLIGSGSLAPGAITWSALAEDVRGQIDSAGDANASAQAAEIARQAAEAGEAGAAAAAGVAVEAAGAANDSASASATSASAALTSRNESAQFAAASEQSKIASEAARDASQQGAASAAGSASTATSKATEAGNYANAASQSKVDTEAAYGASLVTAFQSMPSTFDVGAKFFTSEIAGAPGENALHSDWNLHYKAGEGYIAEVHVAHGNRWLMTAGVIRPVVGRTYRITVRARLNGPVTGSPDMSLFFRELDQDYNYVQPHQFTNFDVNWSYNDYVIEFTPTTEMAYLRPGLYKRDGLTGSGQLRIQSLKVEDVTEVKEAEGHKVAAGVSETAAAASASEAQDAAAGAIYARDVAARVMGAGANPNSIFSYPEANKTDTPDNYLWSDGSGSAISRKASGGKYGQCIEYDTGSELSASKPYIYQKLNAVGGFPASKVEAVEIDFEIELLSGSWGSARIEVRWEPGTGGNRVYEQFFLSDFLPSETGVVQSVTALAIVPDGFVPGDKDELRVFFYGNKNGDSRGEATHTARIHRFDYRVVSKSASSYIQQKALVDLQGNAEASFVMRAKAGAAEGSVEVVAASDPTGAAKAKVKFTGDEVEFNGLSVFGGHLQSDDFSAGNSGWIIKQNGDAEFNNLVVRDWVQDGAVSDGATFVDDVARSKNDSSSIGPFSLGEFSLGQFWQMAVRFRVRARGLTYYQIGTDKDGNPVHQFIWHRTQVFFQWRKKEGGVWGAYETLADFGISPGDTVWREKEFTVAKQGTFEEVQIRLLIGVSSGSGWQTSYTNIDDVSIVARALVR